MTQWSLPRNVYMLSSMNKSSETTHILTTHNTNTPSRNSPTIFDDSLTNLSWLHDINILKRTIPTINSGNNPNNNKRKEQSVTNGALYPNDIDDNHHPNDIDDDQWKIYRTNPNIKPVYSYYQLILLAMKYSGHEKMSLIMICEWIVENFPYFKKMEPTWQNSIRLNLLSNKCFIKISRNKKETGGGKGGFYKLSSDYQRQMLQKQQSLIINHQEQTPSAKRIRSSKRSTNSTKQGEHMIQNETWIDSVLPCVAAKSSTSIPCHGSNHNRTYVRMPSSFLSPISSPDSLAVPPFNHQQQTNDLSSTLSPSPSSSSSSLSSAMAKQNLISTKLDDADMLLLDSVAFDWDAYLCETPNDIDLSTKTEQDLFNDFNAALTDLTYSAEIAAAGGDTSAFDGFDYSSKHSTFSSLFEDDEQSLKIKGRGIKRPLWWLTNDNNNSTKLPSLETAFDLKLSK